jgi:hypothetical protein
MSEYKCSLCDYTTYNKSHIKKHHKSIKCKAGEVVIEEGKAECDICNKEFETKAYLKAHRETCFQKHTKIVEQFSDSKDIVDEMNTLKIVVMAQNERLGKVLQQNEELTKALSVLMNRVEILETSKKKGYDELSEDEEGICEDTCIDVFTARSSKEILSRDGIVGNTCYVKA